MDNLAQPARSVQSNRLPEGTLVVIEQPFGKPRSPPIVVVIEEEEPFPVRSSFRTTVLDCGGYENIPETLYFSRDFLATTDNFSARVLADDEITDEIAALHVRWLHTRRNKPK